jgi:hypothetical protein
VPFAKIDWIRNPNAYTFDALGTESLGPVNIAASQATTTVQTAIAIPCSCKIVKVGVLFGAAGAALAATFTFNIVYNTVVTPYTGGTYTLPAPAGVGNDNMLTGPSPGGNGVTTNYATDGTPLFSADVSLTTANFPGATQAGGGTNNFVPTLYDCVYPNGPFTNANTGVVNANLQSYFTLRMATPAAGTVAQMTVTLFYVPVTMRQEWQTPANPQNQCIPGIAF